MAGYRTELARLAARYGWRVERNNAHCRLVRDGYESLGVSSTPRDINALRQIERGLRRRNREGPIRNRKRTG